MKAKNQNEIERLEQEIENQQRNVSFDTKEYTIEIIVQKYLSELEKNKMSSLCRSIRENLFGIHYASHDL